MREWNATPLVIGLIKLYTIGALIIIAMGIVLIVFKHPDISGMEAIVFGFSVIALAFASLSGLQMKALTYLNFDEKMAMMVGYANTIKIMDTENLSKEIDRLEYVLNRCKYDLRALSHLRYWAKRTEKVDLINDYVIDVINNALIKDTCKNNRKEICELIQLGLKICPKHKELENLKGKYCANLPMKRK